MKVLESSLLSRVGSASLASGIGGERSGERKSWGEGVRGLELEFECVQESVCMWPCVCAHTSLIHVLVVHTCPGAACPCPCVCMCTYVCGPTCGRMECGGARVGLLPVVQHLTPHTIRGIPAIPGTWPGRFWENGSSWEGWECFLLW